MEIHKPKPWHSVREFLKEYLIIVVGVLTALAAEQVVERIRDTERSREARENIRAELSANLGVLAVRHSIESCVSRRLDEADALLNTVEAGQPLPDPIWIGHAIMVPMRDSQYRTAAQGGRLSLLTTGEQAEYANIYASLAEYGEAAKTEAEAWADLRTLERRPKASPALEWGLHHAIEQARQARWIMEIAAATAERASGHMHIAATGTGAFSPSACLPLNTPRVEALKRVVAGRASHRTYDEP